MRRLVPYLWCLTVGILMSNVIPFSMMSFSFDTLHNFCQHYFPIMCCHIKSLNIDKNTLRSNSSEAVTQMDDSVNLSSKVNT
ncbi:hypothetical protein RJT34_17446 [Clitoria ternatea]|uniref:Uncharacterized protein n=1 Tax=Clitoria ternatea TaxID=43366 RepID=A0AAN9PEV2_CLITE